MPSPKTAVEDLDDVSIISGGSTISVISDRGENGIRPTSGRKRTKSSQGKRPKPGKSPYAIKHPPSPRTGQGPKVTTRDMWLTSMRSGSAGLTTQMYQGADTWAEGRSKRPNSSSAMAKSNINLFTKTMQQPNMTKNHARSASATSGVIGKGPMYKTQEEYYDEVIALKKSINQLKAENELLKTKVNRVEGENIVKNRRIDELLNPNQQQEELRRTLTAKNPDSSAVVSSLKQKLHNMERTVKDKESELSKLKKDMRNTDINELRLQLEAYHQEVNRLNMVLMDNRAGMLTTNSTAQQRPKSSKGRLNHSSENRSVEMLKERNRQLQLENQSLRKDLVAAVSGGGKNTQDIDGVDYADMNRVELLQTIHTLQEKLRQSESSGKITTDVSPEGRKKEGKDVSGAVKLSGSPNERLQQLQEREQDLLEEIEKQKTTIEKLKEDRTHYRKVADELRQQLERTEQELQANNKETQKKTSALSRQNSKDKEATKEKVAAEETQTEDSAARVLQKNWRQHRQWKSSKLQAEDEKRQKEEEEYDQAVVDLQAALRAHNVRWQQLEKGKIKEEEEEEMSDDEAVLTIQSAARGHLARKQHYDQLLQAEQRKLQEWRIEEEAKARRNDQGRFSLSRDEDRTDGFQPRERTLGSPKGSKGEVVVRRPGVRQSSIPERQNSKTLHDAEEDEDEDSDDVVVTSSKRTQVSQPGRGTKSKTDSKVYDMYDKNKRQDTDDVARRPMLKSDKQASPQRPTLRKRNVQDNDEDDDSDEDSDGDVVVTSSKRTQKKPGQQSAVSKDFASPSRSRNTNSPKSSKTTPKSSRFEIAESDSDEGVVLPSKQTKSQPAGKKDTPKPQKRSREVGKKRQTKVEEDSDSEDEVMTSSKRPIPAARRGSSLKNEPSSSGTTRKSTKEDVFSGSGSRRSSQPVQQDDDDSDDDDDDDDDIVISSKKSGKKPSTAGAAGMWGKSGSSRTASNSSFGKSSPKRGSSSWSKQSDEEDDILSSSRTKRASALDELF